MKTVIEINWFVAEGYGWSEDIPENHKLELEEKALTEIKEKTQESFISGQIGGQHDRYFIDDKEYLCEWNKKEVEAEVTA